MDTSIFYFDKIKFYSPFAIAIKTELIRINFTNSWSFQL